MQTERGTGKTFRRLAPRGCDDDNPALTSGLAYYSLRPYLEAEMLIFFSISILARHFSLGQPRTA